MPVDEGSEHYMQQEVVEGLESELRRVREISAQLGIGASADVSGLVLEYEARIQTAKNFLHSLSRVRAEGSGVQHRAVAYAQPGAEDVFGDGEVQHEAPAHMVGDESQFEVCAWPFLRAERAACVAMGAARPAAGSRRRSDIGDGKHSPSNSQLKAKQDNGDGEAQHVRAALSQPKTGEVNGDSEVQNGAPAHLNGEGKSRHEAVPHLQPKAIEVKQITVDGAAGCWGRGQ